MENKITLEKIKKGTIWFLKSYLWVIILLIGLDALTKWLFEIYLPDTRLAVIPNFFYFEVTYNKGMAWGTFANQTVLLACVSFIAGLIMIGFLAYKYKTLNKLYKVSLYLMIAGCYGNFIDRAFYEKGVIDFIQFVFGSYIFPTFNLADSYLVIGCIILLITLILEDFVFKDKKDKKIDSSKIEESLNNAGYNKEENKDGENRDK